MRRGQQLLLWIVLLLCSGALWAQDQPATKSAADNPAQHAKEEKTPPTHKFWDKENALLFAGVGAVRMLDYASTRHLRDQGDYEWLLTNSIVDNRPLFVGIEIGGAPASIGVSYAFHRTGHHSLERWVSIVHIGVGVGGSIHNYLLKPVPSGGGPGIVPVMPMQAWR